MSYILEALKKAQAERQLGHTPDIHATPLHAAAPVQQRTSRTRLWIGACGATVIALVAAAWSLKPAGQGAIKPAGQGATATAVLAANSAAPGAAPPGPPAPAPAIAPAPALPVTAPAQAAAPAPAASGASHAALAAQPPAVQPPAVRPPPRASTATQSLASAAPLPAGAPRAASAAPSPAQAASARDADDTLPTARELPDTIRQALPQVTLGGYIYATNPADRLVLIDKALRHEGEEIAPGLTLERLQPRYAVLNFRGTRYRVAY